jgi:hypothetical protein
MSILRPRHFAVVHDCGHVIGRDGVKNQIRQRGADAEPNPERGAHVTDRG